MSDAWGVIAGAAIGAFGSFFATSRAEKRRDKSEAIKRDEERDERRMRRNEETAEGKRQDQMAVLLLTSQALRDLLSAMDKVAHLSSPPMFGESPDNVNARRVQIGEAVRERMQGQRDLLAMSPRVHDLEMRNGLVALNNSITANATAESPNEPERLQILGLGHRALQMLGDMIAALEAGVTSISEPEASP